MSFQSHIWDQIKSITAGELISALEKDGWVWDTSKGSIRTYRKVTASGAKRVQVHFHGGNKGWGPKLVKKILSDIGWSDSDMSRLGLITNYQASHAQTDTQSTT